MGAAEISMRYHSAAWSPTKLPARIDGYAPLRI
jgi:hypothetical protein